MVGSMFLPELVRHCSLFVASVLCLERLWKLGPRTALYVCGDYSDMMNRTLACVVLNRYSSVVAIRRNASSVIDPMDAPG